LGFLLSIAARINAAVSDDVYWRRSAILLVMPIGAADMRWDVVAEFVAGLARRPPFLSFPTRADHRGNAGWFSGSFFRAMCRAMNVRSQVLVAPLVRCYSRGRLGRWSTGLDAGVIWMMFAVPTCFMRNKSCRGLAYGMANAQAQHAG